MQRQVRDGWIAASDAELLRACEVDTYRASGPGGQKRNKTSSAVRLRHQPSGLMVIAEESRSQHENKAKALKRLRLELAKRIRAELSDDCADERRLAQTPVSMKSAAYPLLVAALLDVLAARRGSMRESAALLGVTTGQLSRLLTRDPKLLAAANEIRSATGQRPIVG